MKQTILPLLIFVFALPSLAAEKVEISRDELSRESVTPVFDTPEAVKRRYVSLRKKIEVGIMGGATLNDPFFDNYPLGISAVYHMSETHGFAVNGFFYISSQASVVEQIKNETQAGDSIPFEDAPYPTLMLLAQYEFTPYYGKISFTKQQVNNIWLSFTAGAGSLTLNNDSSLVLAFGMNQRLFLTKRIAFKADLQALFYQQEDIVLRTPEKKNVQAFQLMVGASYVF